MKCYVHPEAEAIGTCTNCGKMVCSSCAMEVGGKLVCKNCVQNMANGKASTSVVINKKEPLLSLILSFIFPGLGQLYNGDGSKGLILIIAAAISIVLMAVCIGVITYILIWLYGMFDAYTYAENLNKGLIRG